MTAAQRNLELVLGLRAEALRQHRRADPGRARPRAGLDAGDQRASPAQMQAFLASDVVYSQRVAPLIKRRPRRATGVSGQTIAGSRFLPDVGWLAPGHGRRASSAAASGSGAPARPAPSRPASTATASCRSTVGGVTLQPGGASTACRPPTRRFTVKFANQGDNDEQNVKVTVCGSRGGGKTIVAEQDRRPDEGRAPSASVTIPLGAGAAGRTRRPRSPSRSPRSRARRTIDNNKPSYTVIFTR